MNKIDARHLVFRILTWLAIIAVVIILVLIVRSRGDGQVIKKPSAGGSGSGTVTSVQVSGGSTGLSVTGGPITTSGTMTITGHPHTSDSTLAILPYGQISGVPVFLVPSDTTNFRGKSNATYAPIAVPWASITGVPKDTITKALLFSTITAPDSGIVYEMRRGGYTLREIRAIREGGTSSTVNVTKNGSTDCLGTNYSTTTSMASAGTVINGTCSVGDLFRISVRDASGSQNVFVQLTFDK